MPSILIIKVSYLEFEWEKCVLELHVELGEESLKKNLDLEKDMYKGLIWFCSEMKTKSQAIAILMNFVKNNDVNEVEENEKNKLPFN